MREHVLALTPPERRELKKRLRSRTLPAEDVRRARLILMLAQGDSYSQIRQALACNRSYISRWKQRFVEQRLAGCMPGTPVGPWKKELRSWRLVFWPGPARHRRTDRPTGAPGNWPSIWVLVT